MKWLCKKFGHKLPTGYANGRPYLRIGNIVTDGIGTKHAYLYAECDRCGVEYHVASTHLLSDARMESLND